jgi:hypothetical protein
LHTGRQTLACPQASSRPTCLGYTDYRHRLVLPQADEHATHIDDDGNCYCAPSSSAVLPQIAFSADAVNFSVGVSHPAVFDLRPSIWPRLRQLVLKSSILWTTTQPKEIEHLLFRFGVVAFHMPVLETLEVWYACDASATAYLFQFVRVRPTSHVAGQAGEALPFTVTSTAISQEELPQLTLYSTWPIPPAAFSTEKLTSVLSERLSPTSCAEGAGSRLVPCPDRHGCPSEQSCGRVTLQQTDSLWCCAIWCSPALQPSIVLR